MRVTRITRRAAFLVIEPGFERRRSATRAASARQTRLGGAASTAAEAQAQDAIAGEGADEELVADAQADGAAAHWGALAAVGRLGRERLRIDGDDLEGH